MLPRNLTMGDEFCKELESFGTSTEYGELLC